MQIDRFIECIKQSWSIDTAQPHSIWPVDKPSTGQCAVTSLLLMRYIPGAKMVRGTVLDENQLIVHYWLLMPNGTELDITRDQFVDPHFLSKEVDPLEQYYRFSDTERKLALLTERTLRAYEAGSIENSNAEVVP